MVIAQLLCGAVVLYLIAIVAFSCTEDVDPIDDAERLDDGGWRSDSLHRNLRQ